MVHMGCWVDDNFYAALNQAAQLEERKLSDFIRIAVRDRVVAIRERYGFK